VLDGAAGATEDDDGAAEAVDGAFEEDPESVL